MENFSQAIDDKIFWIQPKALQRRFVLRSGEAEYAALEFQSAFGSLAAASTGMESWTFKRVGFFHPRVTVRKTSRETDLGVYRQNWTGTSGTLELTGGRSYSWKVANFWATRYTFLDSLGRTLITYQSGVEDARISDLFKVQARVEVDPAARDLPELPLLVLFGWYLIILAQEDSAATTAASTAAIG